MTEQTITGICAECTEQFQYVLKPGFPRKYCVKCGDEKKASYQSMQNPQENMQVPVVRPGAVPIEMQAPEKAISGYITPKVEQKALSIPSIPSIPKSPYKEFHLSPEQVNTNALDLAIKVCKEGNTISTIPEILKLAIVFKEFIENGN